MSTGVRVLDITTFGVAEDSKQDITDLFLQRGVTADMLLDSMVALRAELEGGPDVILAAMEAAFLELSAPRTEYTASLVSEDDILARPALSYVVESFIPRGMASVIFGEPGSGKTFMGQDAGNAVRAGTPWHGHPVARGAVLALEAEGLEQLQARILAWREHHGAVDLAPFRALDEPLALSTPSGAAALVRTILGMQESTGEKVELVWVDPAALYMASSENDDGNRDLILGLNAVAKYLNIGVLLIVHTNALGQRARGTDHFRMLSGSYMRVEKLDERRFGLVQEKVKNTYYHALIVEAEPVGPSLVLVNGERMSAAEYEARKNTKAWSESQSFKLSEATAKQAVKDDIATERILQAVRDHPNISKTQLQNSLVGNGIGGPALDGARQRLIDSGRIVTTDGPRNALLHCLSEAEERAK